MALSSQSPAQAGKCPQEERKFVSSSLDWSPQSRPGAQQVPSTHQTSEKGSRALKTDPEEAVKQERGPGELRPIAEG